MAAGAGDPQDRSSAQRVARVLVVDDDAVLGAAITRILEPTFKVTFAQSGSGALGRINTGAQFAAIVCDVAIPGMTGIELYEEVARTDPALARRFVFVSGTAADDPEFRRFLSRTDAAFLPKPFDRRELLALVSRVADRG